MGGQVFGAASAATRLYPQFNNIALQDIGAISSYNALIVSLKHRWSQGYVVSANYTWSHSISDAPDVNSFEQNLPIEDPTSRARDRGDSIVNRPHAFSMSTVIAPTFQIGNGFLRRLANNNQLAALVTLSSGDQQNIVANLNLNMDSIASVSRPLYLARNTARGQRVSTRPALHSHSIYSLGSREA